MIGHLIRTRTYIGAPVNRFVTETVWVEGDAAACVLEIIAMNGVVEHVTEVIEDEGTARNVTHDMRCAVAWEVVQRDAEAMRREIMEFVG